MDALHSKIGPHTCAVLIEPIQGEGGVRCPDDGYLEALRQVCDETGILLIFDEIQTGMGRTGKLFAYEHFGIEPGYNDIGEGPWQWIAHRRHACQRSRSGFIRTGRHASTFGGTPIITAASLEVVKVLSEENIIAHCANIGAYFEERLLWLKSRHELIVDVRGKGLLLGMKLEIEGTPIVDACLAKGFLINCIQEKILRFIPPLTIEKEDIDALVACLDEILD